MESNNQTENKASIKINATTLILLGLIIIPVIYLIISNNKTTEKTEEVLKTETPAAPAKPSNPEFDKYFQEGFVAYKAKDFNKAIELTLKAIEIDPNSARAYNNLGSAYNELQMWDKGIEACKKAIELDPNFQLAKNNLNWVVTEKEKAK